MSIGDTCIILMQKYTYYLIPANFQRKISCPVHQEPVHRHSPHSPEYRDKQGSSR